MGVWVYSELVAWQLADEFKREVMRLVTSSAGLERDLRYRSQLLEAASVVSKDIAEGFLRRSPRDFARFLGFASGSLVEAELRLRDGIDLGYFTNTDSVAALNFAKRATVAIGRLRTSQRLFAETQSAGSSRGESRTCRTCRTCRTRRTRRT